jgi:hypothetical protein
MTLRHLSSFSFVCSWTFISAFADPSGRGKSDALPKYFSFAEKRYRRSGNSDFSLVQLL